LVLETSKAGGGVMEMLYYTWEMFTMDEKNAWWLMMVVFAITCITFIYTNVKMRVHLQKVEEKQDIVMASLYIMSDDNPEIQDMIESYEEEE
jgi:MFS-type transporter involved in bile tolerance (Atg22 family)